MTASNIKVKVLDLAELLGITQKTVYRMIDRSELMTCQELVNNRPVTFIELTNASLEELKKKYSKIDSQNSVNVRHYDDNVTEINTVNNSQMVDIVDKMQTFILTVNDRHNGQVKEYVDRLISAEKQVLLLEDLEKRKETGYLQQIAELKADKEIQNERIKKLLEDNTELSKLIQNMKNELDILKEKKANFFFWKK